MAMHSDPRDATTEMAPVQGDQPVVVYVREPTHWGRRLLVFVGVIGILVATFFGLMAANVMPKLHNPFATQTTDRSGPVLLESIQDLSRYVAAEGNFQVIVDVKKDARFIPNVLVNDHILFIGVGSVDAYVDFSGITEGAIVISPDGSSVEITLPEPVLEKPSLDLNRSYPYDVDKGLANKVAEFFGDKQDLENQVYQLAEDKIAAAATESQLIARAEKNTRAMLESLLHQLGFERVTVNFVKS